MKASFDNNCSVKLNVTLLGIKRSVLAAGLSLVCAHAAAALDDPTADEVFLKKNCGTSANCVTTVGDLVGWIEAIRRPNEASPLLVSIGPGTFTDSALTFTCNKTTGFRGYISFKGAGRELSILDAPSTHSFGTVNACKKMSFSSMSVKNSAAATPQDYAVIAWNRGGSSTWTDVNVEGHAYAWYEPMCGTPGTHYWYNSRLKVTRSSSSVATTYDSTCDESWFYGSELTVMLAADDPWNDRAAVVAGRNGGILHIYGSVLRAGSEGAGGKMAGAVAIGGEIHMHGVGMDFMSSSGNPATALSVSSGGHIHAAAAAYSVHTSGTFTRETIGTGGGTIDAPYVWGARPAALLERIISVDGEDTAIDTAAADGKPHALIYRGICSRRWYDSTADACW